MSKVVKQKDVAIIETATGSKLMYVPKSISDDSRFTETYTKRVIISLLEDGSLTVEPMTAPCVTLSAMHRETVEEE